MTYQEASKLHHYALRKLDLEIGFKTRLLQPTYNSGKGIPWLVKNWPEIEQYLMLRTLYELGTPEILHPHDKETTEEQEQEIEWLDD